MARSFICVFASVLFVGAFVVAACSKDSDKDEAKGGAIGAPAVEPPVSRNLPSGIAATSLRLAEASAKDTAINALKDLISPDGQFVGVVQRLRSIDERMAELDMRAQTSTPRACLAADSLAKAYDVGGKAPNSQTIAPQFQCQEDLTGVNSDAQLAFGLTATDFYLMEVNRGSLAVFSQAPRDGSGVTVWQIGYSSSQASFIHIKASDASGFEATVAGTDTSGQSGANPCGIHVKSNSKYIYMRASIAANGCSSQQTYCLDASSLADAAASECTNASLSTFELTSLTPAMATAAAPDAQAIVSKKITGFIDFTKESVVTEAE